LNNELLNVIVGMYMCCNLDIFNPLFQSTFW